MKKLRVLFVSHSHPNVDSELENMGGMQRVSLQLWKELHESGLFEVEGMILEADWREIGRKTAFFLGKLLLDLPEKCASFKPDVILFSSMVTASLAPLLRKKIRIPMVSINHGQDVTLPNFVYQFWLKKTFKALNATISVSAATREQTVNRGMPPKAAFIIPNGFYPEKNEFHDRKDQRQQLYMKLGIGWNPEVPLLLTVGRQVKRKGHRWFIQHVLPKISAPVNYLIIGDGPEAVVIRRASKSLPNVVWAGKKSDEVLKLAYRGASLFIMPNIPVPGDMEGFGIVLIEANASGVPVVASRLEGMIDVIEDGQNGILVEPLQPEAFASTIDALLSSPLEELSNQTRAFAEAHFSWDIVIQNYRSVLSKVIESGIN